jgi:hypothetical protein
MAEEEKMSPVAVRLDSGIKARIDEYCVKNNIQFSQFARDALAYYLLYVDEGARNAEITSIQGRLLNLQQEQLQIVQRSAALQTELARLEGRNRIETDEKHQSLAKICTNLVHFLDSGPTKIDDSWSFCARAVLDAALVLNVPQTQAVDILDRSLIKADRFRFIARAQSQLMPHDAAELKEYCAKMPEWGALSQADKEVAVMLIATLNPVEDFVASTG